MTLIPCILYRKSTASIIDFDTQLNSDSLPVSGLDPDLEYYAKHTPYTEPEYDGRGFMLVKTGEIKTTAHPDWPDLKAYEITYSLLKRTTAELNESVLQAHELADRTLRSVYKNSDSKSVRAQRVQNKKLAQITTSPKEDALLQEIDELADKLDQNADNADLMYDFIEAHEGDQQIPDFDDGWVIS